MTKQVTIHLARRITLNRAGHDAIELAAGRNTVDADVAAHAFVKAHTVEVGPDHSDELDELRKQAAAGAARIADLEEQLAQKVADLEALVASMTPPADAKPAKAKA